MFRKGGKSIPEKKKGIKILTSKYMGHLLQEDLSLKAWQQYTFVPYQHQNICQRENFE